MRLLLRLLSFLRPYWYLTAGAYVCVVLNAIFTLVVPSLLGQAVDHGISQGDMGVVGQMGLLILAASTLRGIAAFAQGYLAEASAQGVRLLHVWDDLWRAGVPASSRLLTRAD